MKTLPFYTTFFALLLTNVITAQTKDSTDVKPPMVIDGKKMKITIDTKGKSDKTAKKTKKKTYARRIYDTDDETKNNGRDWFNFDLGFNFLANNGTLDMPEPYKGLELQNGKGCNFNLKIYQQSISLVPQQLYFVYGAGIDWNNYRFRDNVDLIKDADSLKYTLNTTIDYKKNKLVSTYLTIPLLIKYKFKENKKGDAFQIAAGPQFGYLLNSHTKQKWDQGGDQKKKTNGDFNLSEFRIGYSLYLGYEGINFYARYYPESAFKQSKGPDVNTVCVGLAIGGF